MNKILFIISFYNFFDNFYFNNISNINQRIESISNNTFISNCFFSFLNLQSGSGSAIFFNSINFKILIEGCIFQSCISQLKGGAISAFGNNMGSIIINKNCAFQCQTGQTQYFEGGQFSYIETSSEEKNWFLFNSIYFCSINSNNRNAAIHIQSGNQILTNSNFSKNFNYRYPGFFIINHQNLNIKFNTLSHCISTYRIGIRFENGNGILENCNFLNNSINDAGLIRQFSGETIIQFCYFKQNQGLLFTVESGNLFISFCNFQHPLDSIGIEIINCSFNFSQFPYLNHFSTIFCQTEFKFDSKLFKSNLNIQFVKLVSIYLVF